MADLTTEDLARLRVPLLELPGLDPAGLRLPVVQLDPTGSIYVSHYALCIRAEHWADAPHGDVLVAVMHGDHRVWDAAAVAPDLADAATRDRCARWLTGR